MPRRLQALRGGIGPVDFLVNNIGIFDVNDFFDVTDERWLEYFQHNVLTAVRITRLIMKDMLEANSGSICFISSEAAVRSIGNMVPYSTTKTAILGPLAQLGRTYTRHEPASHQLHARNNGD